MPDPDEGEEALGTFGVRVHPDGVRGGLRLGICAAHLSSSTAALKNHEFIELTWCTWALSSWNRVGPLSFTELKF